MKFEGVARTGNHEEVGQWFELDLTSDGKKWISVHGLDMSRFHGKRVRVTIEVDENV